MHVGVDMKDCYNGYEEMHLTGSQLKNLFRNSFYCTGRHHESMISLPIPIFLETLNIKNDKTYRIFYNNCFCKIMNEKTDGEISFSGMVLQILQNIFLKKIYIFQIVLYVIVK